MCIVSSPALPLFCIATVITFVFMLPVCAMLRRAGIVDRPNERSSHSVPTVRGGGVAIIVSIALVIGCTAMRLIGNIDGCADVHFTASLSILFVCFFVLAVVSFIDDIRGTGAHFRFAVHGATAFAVVFALGEGSAAIHGVVTYTVSLAVTWLWIVGYTNAFNFMDGINGIAGVQAVITGAGSIFVGDRLGLSNNSIPIVLASVTAGAALGFLPHNFPRARVFMGDVGSAPLGFLLAAIAVWISHLTVWWALFWIGLLHANFVLDTGITVVRRGLRGDRLRDAHREHFYQRLVRAGWSHTSVTLTEAGLQVLVALALWQATNTAWPIKVAVGGAVIVVWLAFFGFAEHVFCKSAAGVTDAEMLAARRRAQRDPDGAVR